MSTSKPSPASGRLPDIGADADRPVEEPGGDALNRGGFVARLAATLVRESGDEPLVVGLLGSWGSGKTSILNLVAHALKERQNVVVVRFNPWFFTGEQELLLGLFTALTTAIGSSGAPAKDEAIAALKRYSEGFAVAAGLVPVVATAMGNPGTLWWTAMVGTFSAFAVLLKGAKPAVDALQREMTVEQRRERVGNALRASGLRLVVLIDDIDRLYPADVRTVFKLVRLVADLPNVSYLLAFDRDEVASCLNALGTVARERQHGDAYLEKIVQVPVPLPKARPEDLRRMAFDGFDAIIERYALAVSEKELQRLVIAWPRCFEARPRTIRQVKRIVNAADFAISLLSDEVNAVDLMLFETLRVVYPDVVEAIREAPEAVLRDGRHKRRGGAQAPTALDAVLEGVPAPEREGVVEFLGDLFPRFRQAHSEGFDVQWRQERRIASDEHLEKVFDYGVPSGLVSERHYAALLAAAEAPTGDGGAALSLALDTLVRQAGWADLIWRLRQDQERLSAETALRLALEVAKRSRGLGERDGIQGILASGSNAALFVMQVLRRLDEPERSRAAERVVKLAATLRFAARFVTFVVNSSKDDDTPPDWSTAVEASRTAFGIRATEEMTGPDALLTTPQAELLETLFRWKDAIGEPAFAAKMKDWLGREPQAAVAMCAAAIPRIEQEDFGSPIVGIHASNGYSNLMQIVDPAMLAGALGAKVGEAVSPAELNRAASAPHQEQARVLFLRAHEQRRSSAADPDELMTAIVNVVVDEFLRTNGGTTGLLLRRRLRGDGREAVSEALERCVPKWLRRGNPVPHDDYRPTLVGLLASPRGADVERCLQLVLEDLRDGVDREGLQYMLRSTDLATKTGFDVPFLSAVLAAARLTGGGHSSGNPVTAFDYGPPTDVEEILECANVKAFVRYRESAPAP